jgi:hypothetical protein
LPSRTLCAVAALLCLIFLGLVTLAKVGEYRDQEPEQCRAALALAGGRGLLLTASGVPVCLNGG